MKLTSNRNLGKKIEATASNRPLKIAYFIPVDDDFESNMIIDAVFNESYTRWAGAYTLIVPARGSEFIDIGYDEWIKYYDPDAIYSYVNLDTEFIEKIERICCPIVFINHKKLDNEKKLINWRSFTPSWDHYFQPVSSMSTIRSPTRYQQFSDEEGRQLTTVFTQFEKESANRFLADNFGFQFSLFNAVHAIPGLFKTMCLVPADLPAHMDAGTERCFTVLESFRAISDRKVTTISELAMRNSTGISILQSASWGKAFKIFIGSAPLDRINFWNSRHFGNSWSNSTNALILELDFFNDGELVKLLGEYLNKNNFLGSGNGPNIAEVHSSSIVADELRVIAEKINKSTWNTVHVSDDFCTLVVPSDAELFHCTKSNNLDSINIKITEDVSKFTASEPAHFAHIPSSYRGITRGQWIVDLNIQRHHNLSRYSNVVDTWVLPRRLKIARAFTSCLAKPTIEGRLSLVPSLKQIPFGNMGLNSPISYEIRLPSDEDFYRYLVLDDIFQHPHDDLRHSIQKIGYAELDVSDKGQNLRGVISLFDNLASAFDILTSKYWRTVLAEAKDDSITPLTFDLDLLFSYIPSCREFKEVVAKELNLKNIGVAGKYLNDNLRDTLEYLVRLNVFNMVAHWRCSFCGHLNSRSFDSIKIRNECNICATEYLAPIDIKWMFELNSFVHRSLQKHSGMPVLWTLGFLQAQVGSGSFWYLPEVNLYEKEYDRQNANEIDILCILNGTYYAVEAKRTVAMFLNKADNIDKFIRIISFLRPDVALLSFETYGVEGEDVDALKVRLEDAANRLREKFGNWTKLEIRVAQDVLGYDEFSADLGWFGPRSQKYY
ncbi:hypothetical protein [Janthinobacterium lividum]|uniref:hypothetical protein n=1 Tax=Janthinobacterium lividum TaxID=29581 RepID=UPI001B82DCB6|nr:hypothetical protein [Janthinobacterium lividum]MBR7634504.1 hypothetical protein [Janthinobacterium lividum]